MHAAESTDTQSHWVTECAAMQRQWQRTWTTRVALTLRAHHAANLEEPECWELARTLWEHLAEDDDAQWYDRCGLFKASIVDDVLEDVNVDTEEAAMTIARKSLVRSLRQAMLEATASVWKDRLEVLRQFNNR